jgi:hypothetical protein
MEQKDLNLILFRMVGLSKLLRSFGILASFSSRAISHFPERLTDVGTMQICHVLYIRCTAIPAIDRISLSLTADVPCTSSDPQNCFTFCEHPNRTRWTEEHIICSQEQHSLIQYFSLISVSSVRTARHGPKTA